MLRIKEELLFSIALLFLFSFVVGFVVFSLMMQSGDRLDMLKYSIQMVARQIGLFATQPQQLDYTNLDKDILGLGIYDSSGNSITHIGTAPAQLTIPLTATASIDEQTKSIKVIHKSYKSFDPDIGLRYIYLEVDINQQLLRIGFVKNLSIIAPFFLIVLMCIFILIYQRNVAYRKKIMTQEQLVRLGEVARTLSHEIKNPLGAIYLQTAYLKRTLSAQKHKPLAIIEEEVARLTQLSKRIADFLRDPVGNPEKIDINDFLKNICERFKHEIEITQEDPQRKFIKADRERLRSIIENLIQNAIESTHDEKDENQQHILTEPVNIKLKTQHGKVIISIIDKGKGINAQGKRALFDPFFTTKSKGSGLGLYIARRFVEALGGSLTLSNYKQGGAEARIILPRWSSK